MFSKNYQYHCKANTKDTYRPMMPTQREMDKMNGSKVEHLPIHSKKYQWFKQVMMRRSFVPYNPLAEEEDYYFPNNFKMGSPYRNRNKV